MNPNQKMGNKTNTLSEEVTQFLDGLNHPLRNEIEALRELIIHVDLPLTENIKWNGPNYASIGGDRITMKIQPPKNIQLIFHRGAKVKEQPTEKLINDASGLLAWRENDRAIATFKTMKDIDNHKQELLEIVRSWLLATDDK